LLVSTLTEWEGSRLPTFSKTTEEEARSGDAFALTSLFQISWDLVEEWVALGRRPLQTYTRFWGIVQRGDYRDPTLDIARPEQFPNDKVFVEFIEGKAIGIFSPYSDKEEEAKITSLWSRRCINRAFDLMGVEYDDWPMPTEQKDEVAEKKKGKKPVQAKEEKAAHCAET
jgi:hypothetical protein